MNFPFIFFLIGAKKNPKRKMGNYPCGASLHKPIKVNDEYPIDNVLIFVKNFIDNRIKYVENTKFEIRKLEESKHINKVWTLELKKSLNLLKLNPEKDRALEISEKLQILNKRVEMYKKRIKFLNKDLESDDYMLDVKNQILRYELKISNQQGLINKLKFQKMALKTKNESLLHYIEMVNGLNLEIKKLKKKICSYKTNEIKCAEKLSRRRKRINEL